MHSHANTVSKLAAALLGLIVSLSPAWGQQSILSPSGNGGGGGMNTSASNALLPTALNNLGANLTGQTFYANAYGSCTWDATHDVGPCINSAITAAYNGGNVLGYVAIPAGTFGVSTTISQTAVQGVSVVGAGGGGNFGVCDTTLKWIGSAVGTVVSFNPSGQAIVGGGLRHLCIDGNNALAGTGIFARGVASAWFEDVEVQNTSVTAWDIDAKDGTNGGFQDNNFIHDNIFQLVAGSASANGWQIGQGATVTGNDTYNSHWFGGLVQYQNGTAFLCGAADSIAILGMSLQPIAGGTGKSLDMLGSTSSALLACRSNRFVTAGGFGGSAGGTAPVAETATNPSVNNYVYQNLESGALLPVINGSATLTYDTNHGDHYSNAATKLVQGGMAFVPAGTNHAVLDIDAANTINAAVAGKFGPTLPIYLLYNNPNIGRNLYFDSGSWRWGKGSTAKYGGVDQFDPATGSWLWAATTAAGNADAAATLTGNLMTLFQNGGLALGAPAGGNLGAGTIDAAGRIRSDDLFDVAAANTNAVVYTGTSGATYIFGLGRGGVAGNGEKFEALDDFSWYTGATAPDNGTLRARLFATGGLNLGAPTGGDKGAGTLNVASGLYVNGVALGGVANGKATSISFVIDGGGSAITSGTVGDLIVPYACTISSATLLADVSGSIVVDIWKLAWSASTPPTISNTIVASAPPTLSSAQSSQDTTLTGWSTGKNVSANDQLRYHVNSATTVTRVTVALECDKT